MLDQEKFMSHRVVIVAGAMMLLAQFGCGRDALQRDCLVDDECDEQQMCVAGMCVGEGEVPDMVVVPDAGPDADIPDSDVPDLVVIPDSPPDMLPPPEDMKPDLPPAMCSVTTDCPGGGEQFADGERCLKSTCLGSLCVFDSIDLGCPPNSVQEGCSCVPLMGECVTSEDCGGQACVNNTCQPCRNSTECDGDLICRDDGICAPCSDDLECAASEICNAGACEPRPECLLDGDCGTQEVCLSGRCSYSPECTTDNDCADGFECIGDRCFEEICRGPEDCAEGEICDAGLCVDQPATVDRCFVATPNTPVSPGQRVQLDAFAVDANGNGIAARFDWTSDNPAAVAIVSGDVAEAQNVRGVARVTAHLENSPIMCEGEVVLGNIGPQTNPNQLRVLVQDTQTGGPVRDAEVYINGLPAPLTDRTGVTNFPIPTGAYEVTVISSPHDWVTVQGVTATDIQIPLNRRSGVGPVAGFSGEFDTSMLSSQGEFNLGLAGASFSEGLINFDLSRLLGDPFMSEITIPGQGSADFPIPGGLTIDGQVFGFPVNVKEEYYATAPGGARLAWGLAGKVPVTDLIALFQGGGIGNVGDVLNLLLPLFNRFDHGVKPVVLNEQPRVRDFMDIDGDGDTMERVPDYMSFPEYDLTPSVRQQLITAVDVSNLPVLTDGPAEFAILAGGTTLDSVGYVPLGISATTDNDGDGRPDVRRLTMAPPYGSLVGGRYAVFSVAFRGNAFGAGASGLEFPDEFSVALWNGISLPTSIQLGTFPDSSSVQESQGTRTLTIDGNAGPLYRARFVASNRSWDVWSLGSPGAMGAFSHTMTIPTLPANRQDLYFTADKVLLDSIRTQVQINSLLTSTGIPLYNAALVSTGYSRTLVRD